MAQQKQAQKLTITVKVTQSIKIEIKAEDKKAACSCCSNCKR